MTAVKVVLAGGVGSNHDQELELGPFNQGVVLEQGDVIDVATREAVAYQAEEHLWRRYGDDQSTIYNRCFIQAVEPSRSLEAGLAVSEAHAR